MRRLYAIAIALAVLLPAAAHPQESIRDYTSSFEKRDGLFPVYWDAAEGRLLLEVPRPGEEFLYLTSLATGLGSNRLGLDRGMIGSEAVARFERVGQRILLVFTNPRFRAPDGSAASMRPR